MLLLGIEVIEVEQIDEALVANVNVTEHATNGKMNKVSIELGKETSG